MTARGSDLEARLERLYARYNRPEHAASDPVALVRAHRDPADREVAGLVASSLAFGRASQILASARKVLEALGPPGRCLELGAPSLRRALSGLGHRFVTGDEIAHLLAGAGRLAAEHGSLGACFASGLDPDAATVERALRAFARRLVEASGGAAGFLVPRPDGASAMKRLNLMLRWMVRSDAVDPGGWEGVGARRLIVPLDTHMHRIGLDLGLTRRATPGMAAALEITAGLRRIRPDDPVRYDFALTRASMLGTLASGRAPRVQSSEAR